MGEIYEDERKLDDYWTHNVFVPLFKSEQHTYQPKDLEVSGPRQNDHVCQIVLSLPFLKTNRAFLSKWMIAALLVQSDSGEEIVYKLNSYWSDLEHIHVNEEVRFMFSEQEQRQIYHLELEGRSSRN